jgi:hypothetical protein
MSLRKESAKPNKLNNYEIVIKRMMDNKFYSSLDS